MTNFSIKELVPHSDNMILVDKIIDIDEGYIIASFTVKEECIFLENNILPNYILIEIMAQSIAAYSGYFRKLNNLKSTLGFLIGCRKFETFIDEIHIHDNLIINSKLNLLDEKGFGIFYSEVYLKDKIIANSSLNVFNPNDGDLKRTLDE